MAISSRQQFLRISRTGLTFTHVCVGGAGVQRYRARREFDDQSGVGPGVLDRVSIRGY